MKRLVPLLLWIIPALFAAPPEKPVRVLFIGNSYTYTHDIPLLLEQIAAAKGRRLETRFRDTCVGGYTLAQHGRRQKTLETLAAGGWDYVVLQEHGGAPLSAAGEFKAAAETFAQEARRRGSRVLYYVTPRSCDAQSRLALADRQAPITTAYLEVAAKTGGRIVPVGPAFVAINHHDKAVRLYEPDNIHPSAWGAYAAAGAFYAVLFDESPAGADLAPFTEPRTGASHDFRRPAERRAMIDAIVWASVQATSPRSAAAPTAAGGPAQ